MSDDNDPIEWVKRLCDEVKLLRKLADSVLELRRGCDCEYDYRCGRCERVIDVYDQAKAAVEARTK